MSNPPAGWYPDPTGQPNTIRWWNGTQWTNKTELETPAEDATEVQPTATEQPTESAGDQAEAGSGWGQGGAGAGGWAEVGAGADGQRGTYGQGDVAGGVPQTAAEKAAAISAAEKARATWTQKPAGSTNASHWTQQAPPQASDQTSGPDPATVAGEPSQGDWKLTLATDPSSTSADDATGSPAAAADGQDADGTQGDDTQGPATEDPFPDHWRTSNDPQPSGPTPAQWGPTGAPQWGADQQAPTHWGPTADPQASTQWGSAEAQGSTPWGASADPQASGQWGQSGQQTGPAPWSGSIEQQSQGQWTGTVTPQTAGQHTAGQHGAGQWGPAAAGAGGWQAGGGPVGGGKRQKPSDGKSGGPSKTMLVVAGAVGLVLIIVAGVFFVANRDDKTADPGPPPTVQATGSPTGTPTDQPTSAPTIQPSTPGNQPGQSKNPKLHEGRIASTAISFPRQRPPWSDRKRLVPQLLNSSGQYVLLQENFDGKNDWYANAFVGSLGTSVLFNGNVQATASDLSTQLRGSLYGNIPVQLKPLRDGAVKRSGKNGWYYQQTVTATNPKITARVLTLTVAVFDLGDGTAVAYISDIPTTRPDLKAAEAQVYKGIHVG